MELRIKASVNNSIDLEILIKKIIEMEKEYKCNCTLLDVTISR